MHIQRRTFLGAAAMLSSIAQSVQAQAGLDMATIVTGFAAGGTSDALARRIAQKLQPDYAKAAVVENRTGAGGQIAVSYVKGRPADGSAMLVSPMSILAIYPHIYKKLPYDVMTDLAPVSIACVLDNGFAVGPAVPASVRNVQDFFTWARANPASANFGSPAAGATPHFAGVLLGRAGNIDLKHIAYRGSQPALLDLIGGNVTSFVGPIGDMMQHMATGKVRILGVANTKRSRFVPDVPTLAEQGLKDMVHPDWSVFFVPAKTPAETIARLNSAIRHALAQKDVIDGLGTFGLDAMASTPAELGELLKQQTAKWAPIVKETGFTVES